MLRSPMGPVRSAFPTVSSLAPRRFRVALVAAALLLGAAPGAEATSLIGVTANGLGGTLYDVDETTGSLSNPRAVIGGLGGLTFLSTGQLVATRHHSSGFGLYEVDQPTGANTLLVNFPTSVIEGGVTENPDTGTIYAVNMNPSDGGIPGLFSIDIDAGTTSFIGSIFDTNGSGTSMDLSALSFDLDGRLWAVRDIGALELVEIDPTSGDVLSFLPITGGLPIGSALAGLAVDPGTGGFYMSYAYQLFDLDKTTGAATLIGGTAGEDLAGLAWDALVIPEPSTSLLLATALTGLALIRKRDRKA